MKLAAKILVCLAGGLVLDATAHADDAVLPGNPYAVVVARNIFGLNPPPPPGPATPVDDTPPPKITPNGIMTIFGQLQVLFKVANPSVPGKPAGDTDYILSEGERQDDIEVVKIDEKDSIITFNNHGIVQELPLAVASSATTSTTGNGGSGFNVPPMPGGGREFGNNSGGSFGRPFGGHNRSNENFSDNNGANNDGNNSSPIPQIPQGIQTPGYHITGPPVDPEVQAVMMAAQREQLKNSGETIWRFLPNPMSSDDANQNEDSSGTPTPESPP